MIYLPLGWELLTYAYNILQLAGATLIKKNCEISAESHSYTTWVFQFFFGIIIAHSRDTVFQPTSIPWYQPSIYGWLMTLLYRYERLPILIGYN